jgi:hypothetical protein
VSRPADVQSALAQFLPGYQVQHRVDRRRRQVLTHLGQCRTAALGGFVLRCEGCDDGRLLFHACRDRHCPKCQQRASQRWAERQSEALLPVAYFHLVFTLPHALNGWVQIHDAVIYRALFQSVWTTLNTFARDPQRGLGGQLGMTAVMHTWGENLSRHVHLHCLVPGGVLREDGCWQAARGTYLFPVKALARHFRGTLVRALRAASNAGALRRITRAGEVDHVLSTLMAHEWVVYAKPCLPEAHTVVHYLARYTHRVAISDQRIVAVDDETVQFSYKDTADGSRRKVMTLAGEEFIRRYLQHILPKGLMRIRHYGFLANRCRRTAITQIRAALAAPRALPASAATLAAAPFTGLACTHCVGGWMVVVAVIAPSRDPGSG